MEEVLYNELSGLSMTSLSRRQLLSDCSSAVLQPFIYPPFGLILFGTYLVIILDLSRRDSPPAEMWTVVINIVSTFAVVVIDGDKNKLQSIVRMLTVEHLFTLDLSQFDTISNVFQRLCGFRSCQSEAAVLHPHCRQPCGLALGYFFPKSKSNLYVDVH